MNQEQAFLEAIREHPEDDTPRLIYADWLEEQGGAGRAARADFIRIQCRLAGLPEDDPARDRLEDEEADLLAEHETEWTQPLHAIAEEWRFSRGFVEHIRIRGENLLTHSKRLFDSTPLNSLHLLIPRNDLSHLAACPQLHWLSSLDFSRCQLNDRALQQLLTSPHLDRLTSLNLDGSDLNTPGIRALIQSPLFSRLRSLDLSRNRAVGDNSARLLAHQGSADNLEILRLCQANLTWGGLDDIFDSSRFPRLQYLHVSGLRSTNTTRPGLFAKLNLLAQLRSLDLSELEGGVSLMYMLFTRLLSTSSNLRELYLRSVHASTIVSFVLAESSPLTNLRLLDAAHNNLRDKGAKAIADSPHLRHLRVLNLVGNGIGGPGLKALAESENLAELRTLHLAGNFIGADSVNALVDSEYLRRLISLDLSDASLEECSARVLASSPNLARLSTLLLRKNLLGDGGAKSLAQSPYLSRLSTLDLNDNRIGKAGAEALAMAAWRRLRNLDLRGNVFTDMQEALLRNRFGNAVQL